MLAAIIDQSDILKPNQIMAYVPGFDYDLFLSYASRDNHDGSVEEVVSVMGKHISDNLVNCFSPQEKLRIYFDRERLATKTAVNWKENLKQAASSSALLVPLLSPNYLTSNYCADELEWFTAQPHVANTCPYSVAGWLPLGDNRPPVEFRLAQHHPAGASSLALLMREERIESVKDFALKLRDALVSMRKSASSVFVGPAVGRGEATRIRLRDELEKSGYRVVPDADFRFKDHEMVSNHIKSSLVAIHFLSGGLDFHGLRAIEESFLPDHQTILITPFGSSRSEGEERVLNDIESQIGSGGRFAGSPYTKLEGKTDDQVWEVVKRQVIAARFQIQKNEFDVGITCDPQDLAGAKEVASVMRKAGIRAQYPSFDAGAGFTKRLEALRDTVLKSQALLCYWASAEGKDLESRLSQGDLRRLKEKAWYLAPPLNVPGKDSLRLKEPMVLEQQAEEVDLAVLKPFLERLGWVAPL